MATFVPPRIQLYRSNKRPSLSPQLTMSLTNKGLLNPTGENNCFLNSAVQILWHIDVFRRSFRGFEGHSCVGKACIFCALKVLFTQFQYGGQSSIPPDILRRAMAECYQEQHRFQLGWMDDAAECFEKLLEQIHFHLTGNDDLDSCSEEFCLPHQKFALNIMERMVCRCGANSEPLAFVQFIHYISTSALITEAKKLGPAPSSSPSGSSHFGTLMRRASKAGEYRECSESGCKKLATMQRVLLNCPDVVCIGLIWDSDQPSVDYIKGVIDAIGLSIKLSDVFDQLASPQAPVNEYQLTGIVAYYGRHYSTFSYHSALKEWVYFDDAKFRKVGPQWSTVVQQCYKAHYQPLLLVYANPKAQNVSLSKAPLETKMIPCDCRAGGRGKSAPLSTLQEEEESEATTPTNQIAAPLTTSASTGTAPSVNQGNSQMSAPSSASTESGFLLTQPLQTNTMSLPNQRSANQQQIDISRDLMEFSINPVGASMTTPTATPLSTAVQKERPPHDHFDPLTHPPLQRPASPQSSTIARPRVQAQVMPKPNASPAPGGDDLMMFSISPMQVSAIGSKYAEAPPTTPPSRTAMSNTAASQGVIRPQSSMSPPSQWSQPSTMASSQPQPGIRYQQFPASVTNIRVPPPGGYRAEVSPPPPVVTNGVRHRPPATSSGVPPTGYRTGAPSTMTSNMRGSSPTALTGLPQQQNMATTQPQAATIGFEGLLRPSVATTTQVGAVPFRATPGYQSSMHGSTTPKLQSGHPGPVVQTTYPTASSQEPLGSLPTQQAKWEHFEASDPVRTRPVPVSRNQPQSLQQVHVPKPIPSSTTPPLNMQFAQTVPPAPQIPPTSQTPPPASDPLYATPDELTKTAKTEIKVQLMTLGKAPPSTSSAPVHGFGGSSTHGPVPEAQSAGLTPPIGTDPLYAVPAQVLQRQAQMKTGGLPQTNSRAESGQVDAASSTASANVSTSNKSTQTPPPVGNDPMYAVPDKSHKAPPRDGPAEVPIGGTQRREENIINPTKVDAVKSSDATISFGAHSTPPIGNDPLYAVPIKPKKQDLQAPVNLTASSSQPTSPAAKSPVSSRNETSPPIGRGPVPTATQSRAVDRTGVVAGNLPGTRTQKTSSLPRSGVRLQPSSDVLVRTTSVGGRPSGKETGSGKTAAIAAPAFQTLPADTRSALVETKNVWSKAEASVGTDKALALVLFTQAIGLLQKVLQDPTVRATPALYQQVHSRKELGVAKCKELRAQLEPPRPRRSEGKNCVNCGRMRTSLNEQSICGPCQLRMKMGRT